MAMLTGRFPHENRVWTNDHGLDSAQAFGARHTEFPVRPSAVDLLDTLI